MKEENPDTWISHCKSRRNLEDAIYCAACSINHLGRKNDHQRRLKNCDLEKFAINIINRKKELDEIQSFSKLLDFIQSCRVKGIGELACYDTAYRIGARLNIFPDKIYLHAGTKKGAEKLLKRKLKGKFIEREMLPAELQTETLSNAELEDILCIYKDSFNNMIFPLRKSCFSIKKGRCNSI